MIVYMIIYMITYLDQVGAEGSLNISRASGAASNLVEVETATRPHWKDLPVWAADVNEPWFPEMFGGMHGPHFHIHMPAIHPKGQSCI